MPTGFLRAVIAGFVLMVCAPSCSKANDVVPCYNDKSVEGRCLCSDKAPTDPSFEPVSSCDSDTVAHDGIHGSVCCASAGYPSNGTTCTCNEVRCVNHTSGLCQCAPGLELSESGDEFVDNCGFIYPVICQADFGCFSQQGDCSTAGIPATKALICEAYTARPSPVCFGGGTSVLNCAERQPVPVESGDDAGGGGSDSSTTMTCTDLGHCSPSDDSCSCGTTCIHYGPGEYLCAFSCSSDADCTTKKDPITGARYGQCHAALDTTTMTYDRWCD